SSAFSFPHTTSTHDWETGMAIRRFANCGDGSRLPSLHHQLRIVDLRLVGRELSRSAAHHSPFAVSCAPSLFRGAETALRFLSPLRDFRFLHAARNSDRAANTVSV